MRNFGMKLKDNILIIIPIKLHRTFHIQQNMENNWARYAQRFYYIYSLSNTKEIGDDNFDSV